VMRGVAEAASVILKSRPGQEDEKENPTGDEEEP